MKAKVELSIDAKKYLKNLIAQARSSIDYAYPNRRLDDGKTHAALMMTEETLKTMQKFLDLIEEGE